MDPEISCGARKLPRIPRLKKHKKRSPVKREKKTDLETLVIKNEKRSSFIKKTKQKSPVIKNK